MEKLSIREVIVVEGIHDKERLEKCVNAQIICSQGTHMSMDFLDMCKRLNERQGIIVFTDPDGPGEFIRRRIIEIVGTCKHASLHVLQSKKKQKVGIEHADLDDLQHALSHAATFDEASSSLSMSSFRELGLNGQKDSAQKRDQLSEHFHFPKCNAKTCFKYLNMLGIDKSSCEQVLKERIYEDNR